MKEKIALFLSLLLLAAAFFVYCGRENAREVSFFESERNAEVNVTGLLRRLIG